MPDRIEAGPPVRLGSRPAGPPVRTGWDAPPTPSGAVTRLDDLTDVDTADAAVGDALGFTGENPPWRPQPQAHAHQQTAPSSVWLILHPLAVERPSVEVYADLGAGADGRRLYPRAVTRPTAGQMRLDFTRPVSGTAYLTS